MFPTWTDGGRRRLGHRGASACVLRRHWLHFSSVGCPQRLQFQQGGFFADYHRLSAISRRPADVYRAPRTWRRHRLGYKSTQSQHGNGVADSLPSGSGNLDVQLGRQRSSNLSRRSMQFQANPPSLQQDPAASDRTGNRDALPLGQPAVKPDGARSDRGPCAERATDRRE
jgi:hypothetical protein